MAWFRDTPEGTVVNVRAKPRSSRPGVDVTDDALVVRVRASPVDGKANKEIIGVLADHFGLPKSGVAFLGGETSKTKRLLLRGFKVQGSGSAAG